MTVVIGSTTLISHNLHGDPLPQGAPALHDSVLEVAGIKGIAELRDRTKAQTIIVPDVVFYDYATPAALAVDINTIRNMINTAAVSNQSLVTAGQTFSNCTLKGIAKTSPIQAGSSGNPSLLWCVCSLTFLKLK